MPINAINLTNNNTGLKVNIALNYGGRDELVLRVYQSSIGL